MQTNALTSLRSVPGIGGLSVAVLLLGFATSFAQPYLSLFGVQRIGMSPLALGVYLTVVALSSIVISTVLARWSDRTNSRRGLVVFTTAAATVGYGLLAVVTSYPLVLLIGALLIGTGAAAFPQLFALARDRAGAQGEHSVTTLRSLFSLAWVVGPGIGAVLLASGGFPGLMISTAVCFALAVIPVLMLRGADHAAPTTRASAPGELHQAAPPATPARPVWIVALSLTLYGTAMQMGAAALPLHVTGELGGTSGNVGFLVGLCALLEIPVMLSFVLRPRRVSNEKLILWGLALFVLYFAVVLAAPDVAWLAVAQAVRAVVIAILATLGMAYVQELMPDRIGVATTLYANTMNAGALLGGLGMGVCAQAFGYRAVFVLCTVLAVVAWGVLLATRRGLRPGRLSPKIGH